jgi:hypothetical protein
LGNLVFNSSQNTLFIIEENLLLFDDSAKTGLFRDILGASRALFFIKLGQPLFSFEYFEVFSVLELGFEEV